MHWRLASGTQRAVWGQLTGSRFFDHLVDHPCVGDDRIGQRFVSAGMAERQSIVIQAELVQDRRMQVGHADAVLDRFVTDVVGLSVDVPSFETATGCQ